MSSRSLGLGLAVVLFSTAVGVRTQDRPLNRPPQGFTNLFNGKDLSGWRGRQQTYSPYVEAKLTKEELAEKQKAWNADRDLHWSVDAAKGEIVSDGNGVHLTTEKDYGDFEFHVDWLMVSPNGDSGVYLRSFPQVQVWDPDNPREERNGAPRGSGALWNNNPDNPGRWPLVKADNPVGQWNAFRIRMVSNRVWVWLNDKLTVDGQIMDNYFERAQPILPRGPIELQTHGSEIRFRNVYVREIPEAEAKAILAKIR
jgi:3-keto-disaccharide hydrolase